jgi:phage terminase large subunit-like protein
VLRWCPDPGQPKVFTRSLEVWAADPGRLHGLTFSLAVVDELQAHQDAGVYVSIASALHKRPGAQLVVISTAGQVTSLGLV